MSLPERPGKKHDEKPGEPTYFMEVRKRILRKSGSGIGTYRVLEHCMNDDVTYNQVVSFDEDGIRIRTVVKSYAEEGELILMFDGAERILIEGKDVDATGHKERVREILDEAEGNGLAVDPKSVMHYAVRKAGDALCEYVLVKW
jgi:hypothetical protein